MSALERMQDLIHQLKNLQLPKPLEFKNVRQAPHLRTIRRQDLLTNQTVGFVPTMGALHEGHLSLIRQAARENTRVYVSIYVNPTQFGVNEDYDSYPKFWVADQEKLTALFHELAREEYMGQISNVFRPSTSTMYPGLPPTSEINGDGSFVTITPLSTVLEGASRPVFFRGVATVCMKLLNIVQPDRVYLGQKDIQQTFVVKRMVEDFHLDTEVRVVPTFREKDGLAMSSRNVYLGTRRRAVAPVLLRALQAIQNAFATGKRTRKDLLAAGFRLLESVQQTQRNLPPWERAMFEVDYLSIADSRTMAEIDEVKAEHTTVISGAIIMLPILQHRRNENLGLGAGKKAVRLIDNIIMDMLTSKLSLTDHKL